MNYKEFITDTIKEFKNKHNQLITDKDIRKILDLDKTTPIFIIRFGAPRTFVLTHKLTDLTYLVLKQV